MCISVMKGQIRIVRLDWTDHLYFCGQIFSGFPALKEKTKAVFDLGGNRNSTDHGNARPRLCRGL